MLVPASVKRALSIEALILFNEASNVEVTVLAFLTGFGCCTLLMNVNPVANNNTSVTIKPFRFFISILNATIRGFISQKIWPGAL
jgi:hypothetical protein